MDINEEQLLSFTYSPTAAKASNLAVEVSDPSLARAEQERIAAEKVEQERIAAQKAEQERIAAQRQNQAQSRNSATVYVTPTGKRYHYSGSCNGGSYSPTTLDNALRMGLTPCKKYVG